MKRFAALIFLIPFSFYSCENKSDNNKDENITENVTAQDTSKVLNEEIPDFDVLKFKKSADSLLSILQHKQSAFNLTTDTLELKELSETESKRMPTGYLVQNSIHSIRYRFDLASPNKDMKFDIVQSQFSSANAVDSAMNHFKYLANEDKVSEGLPGLTYTNDYVIRQQLTIYWLNTPCRYSFENHKKYGTLLVQSLKDKTIMDSLWCKCGAVNCKN